MAGKMQRGTESWGALGLDPIPKIYRYIQSPSHNCMKITTNQHSITINMSPIYQFRCVQNKFFKFDDVLGDGNFFSNCLVNPLHINVSSQEELRGIIVQLFQAEMVKPHNQMEKRYRQ